MCKKGVTWGLVQMEQNWLKEILKGGLVIVRERVKSLWKKCMNEIKGPRKKGKPAVRWKDKVNEYMHERSP